MGKLIPLKSKMTERERGALAGEGFAALLDMPDERLKAEVSRLKSDDWGDLFVELDQELRTPRGVRVQFRQPNVKRM